MNEQRFKSIKKFSRERGVPENFIRREVKQGIVPGFFSGSWFYIDEPQYLEMLSARNTSAAASK